MTIERNNQDIVIWLSADLFDAGSVEKLINHFCFVESNMQNKGTADQAAELARHLPLKILHTFY